MKYYVFINSLGTKWFIHISRIRKELTFLSLRSAMAPKLSLKIRYNFWDTRYFNTKIWLIKITHFKFWHIRYQRSNSFLLYYTQRNLLQFDFERKQQGIHSYVCTWSPSAESDGPKNNGRNATRIKRSILLYGKGTQLYFVACIQPELFSLCLIMINMAERVG